QRSGPSPERPGLPWLAPTLQSTRFDHPGGLEARTPAALDLHAEVEILWGYRVPTADRSPERVHVGWTRSRRPMDEEAVPRGPSARGRRNDMMRPLMWAGLGAGLMYYLDPDRGRSRRARARDRVIHLLHEAEHEAEIASRDLANRTRGLIAKSRSLAAT